MSSEKGMTLTFNLTAMAAVLAVLAYILFRGSSTGNADTQSLDIICREAAYGDITQATSRINKVDTADLDAVGMARLSIACMQISDRGGEETMTARAVSFYNSALKADSSRAAAFYNDSLPGREHLAEMLGSLARNLANPVDVSEEHDIDPETAATPASQTE